MRYEAERKRAAEAGLTRFAVNVPCANGHKVERYSIGGGCVECVANARKKHRAEKADEVLAKRREYRARRGDTELRQATERRAMNPEPHREKVRRWREKNREKESASNRARWPGRREMEMQRKRERYANDPLYALKTTVRNRVGGVFRQSGFRKGSKTEQMVGCTWAELMRHLERQFLRGMTWENRGNAWHIDHIVPLASATTESEVCALCHFSNLRPLWAAANRSKGGRRSHLL
jgi:hypothetical protein